VSRKTRRRDGPTGFLLVDKEAGLTSHDIISRLRKRFDTPAVGHAGTLDPDATGLLLVGVGKATKLLTSLVGLPKIYEATITLGTATSTQDSAGEVIGTFEMAGVTPQAVADAARSMEGESEQIPPMVSAIRIDGKRLHELAREGREVERKPRPITVDRFTTDPMTDPGATDQTWIGGREPAATVAADGTPLLYRATVECSTGTYVRTLAHDLGHALGGGAHLSALRRTRVGEYRVGEATGWEETPLLPASAAVTQLARLRPDDEVLDMVSHGRVLERAVLGVSPEDPGPWAVYGQSGGTGDAKLVATYKAHRGTTVKPDVVLMVADDATYS
jgi:tRNA pseudouridine55 synthase